MIGSVVKFVSEKGYGFLHQDGASADMFFHISNFPLETDQDALKEGDRVEFDMGERRGRQMAINIRIMEE